MIVLNGLVGLSLIAGGLKHRLQEYNLQGAGAHLAVLMPFAVLGLVLPRFTHSAPGGELSALMAVFLIGMSVVLYGVFLGVQMITHSEMFQQRASINRDASSDSHVDHHNFEVASIQVHAIGLLAALLPIVLLALTLIASLVTFVSQPTHVLQGAIHLALFGAYVVLIFDTA